MFRSSASTFSISGVSDSEAVLMVLASGGEAEGAEAPSRNLLTVFGEFLSFLYNF